MRGVSLLLVAALLPGCGREADPCGGVSGSCIALHVEGPAGGPTLHVDQIELSAATGFVLDRALTPPVAGAAYPLPVALAIVPRSDFEGDFTVAVTGLQGGSAVGAATLSDRLTRGEHRSFHVRLAAVTTADGGTIDAPPPPDLYGQDLIGADLLVLPDLAKPDLVPTVFVPSHVAPMVATCDLTALTVIDTANFTVDNNPPPSGCLFASQLENGALTVAVLATRSFNVNAGMTVTVVGDKPLVILASGSITINGTLDASANLNVSVAGGGFSGFGTGAGDPGEHNALDFLDSGGGGGSFGGLGAIGGAGTGLFTDLGPPPTTVGGDPGMLYPPSDPNLLLAVPGGSGGGDGATEIMSFVCPDTGDMVWSTGGGGGGSIQLTAQVKITLGPTAILKVNGGGGRGGCYADGQIANSGGGGGSGGALFLEANVLEMSTGTALVANGGGGGGGADYATAQSMSINGSGKNGGNGLVGTSPAPGGNAGGPDGAAGGAGATRTATAMPGLAMVDNPRSNGGGGGGGVGRIVLRFHTPVGLGNATISPAATMRNDL